MTQPDRLFGYSDPRIKYIKRDMHYLEVPAGGMETHNDTDVTQEIQALVRENQRFRYALEKIEKGEIGGRLANGEQTTTPYPAASLIAKQALRYKESEHE